jgi:hypothetical protein
MKCEKYHRLIGDYLENSIKPAAKAGLDAHLLTCADCRELLNDFRQIAEKAKELDTETPSDDVWPSIRAHVLAVRRDERLRDAAKKERFAPVFGRPRARWAWAGALVLVGAAVGLVVGLRPWKSAVFQPAALAAETQTMAKLAEAEKHYQLAIQAMTEAVSTGQTGFDFRVAALFARDLTAVNSAIAACRAAVTAEPGNLDARVFLLAAYQKKVDVLNGFIDMNKKSPSPVKAGASL